MPPGLCRRGENDAVYHDEVRKRRRYKFGDKESVKIPPLFKGVKVSFPQVTKLQRFTETPQNGSHVTSAAVPFNFRYVTDSVSLL